MRETDEKMRYGGIPEEGKEEGRKGGKKEGRGRKEEREDMGRWKKGGKEGVRQQGRKREVVSAVFSCYLCSVSSRSFLHGL